MDSRIREIEQWIAEAKTDLGERGRDAYLSKLYLLDAEIRNVIRENGLQPEAASPQSSGRRVRRLQRRPIFASGMALSALLLAASTVYFASPGLSLPFGAGARQLPALAEPADTAGKLMLPDGEVLVTMPAGQFNTTLPSSPSEEKAGETTPSVTQAPADVAAAKESSKPSALAHATPQAPAALLIPASRPIHKVPQSAPASTSSPKQGGPAAGSSADKSGNTVEEVAVQSGASGQTVDKSDVNSGDKQYSLDEGALADNLERHFR